MNMIESSRVVSHLPKEFFSTKSFIALASIALLVSVALVSTSEHVVSEAQFEGKLRTAAPDSGLSDIQTFFPASFR